MVIELSLFCMVDSDNATAVKTGSFLSYDCLHQKSVPMGASCFASAHYSFLHGLDLTVAHGERAIPPSWLKSGFLAFLLSKNSGLLNRKEKLP